jgi:hypothetical protein
MLLTIGLMMLLRTFRIYAASDIKISSAAIPKGIDVSQTAVNAKLAEARENPKDFNF